MKIASNSPAALRAADESWGLFPRTFDEAPVEVWIIAAGHSVDHADHEPAYRMQDYMYAIVADAANFATIDLASSFGLCWVTEEVIEDMAYFRHFYLEALAYSTLTYRYLTPVHAACVALEGSGVLLCGASGAGKSCLSFACARRGWSFLTDDFTALVRKCNDRMAIGKPFVARFRPAAVQLFPELRDLEPFVAPNGKPSIELRTAQVPGFHTTVNCRVDHVVFLERQDTTEAHLLEVSPEQGLSRIQDEISLYGPGVTAEQQQTLRNLAPASFHILRYSSLDSAVTALENTVRKVALV